MSSLTGNGHTSSTPYDLLSNTSTVRLKVEARTRLLELCNSSSSHRGAFPSCRFRRLCQRANCRLPNSMTCAIVITAHLCLGRESYFANHCEILRGRGGGRKEEWAPRDVCPIVESPSLTPPSLSPSRGREGGLTGVGRGRDRLCTWTKRKEGREGVK